MRRARVVWAVGASVAAVAMLACVAVLAQPNASNQTVGQGGSSAPAAPAVAPPQAGPAGPPEIEPPLALPTAPAEHAKAASNSASNSLAGAEPPPPAPPPPPKPVRSPSAILQALDKVTAETMRFAAPVGERVRYKNLVFTVKACETSGLGGAEPEASAYVVIESAPLSAPGVPAPAAKEVYRGWMYANSPALHPFQHPIYDAWLIACMASAPRA